MKTLAVVLLTLGDPERLTGGYLYHRRMAELATSHEASLQFVSFPERPFPLAALDAHAVLHRAHQLGPHAIVLDSIAAAFAGPSLVLRAPDVPLIGMLHQPPGGIDHGPLRTALQAVLDKLAYRKTELLMIASESLAEQVRLAGLPRERLRVVPPGRDVAATIIPPAGDVRRGRDVAFLCVGNWLENKGIVDLLRAFAQLDPALGTLHLVGDDQADARYSRRVRAVLSQRDLADRVVVHGPISRERVAGLYAAVDVFVLPSYREAYGTVYGEAMSAGLPVVGWRAGNLPHLAEHEVEGMLVPPGDVEGLARAMDRLARYEALRHRLGAAALRRAGNRPTWNETAGLFFESIRQVVEAEGAGTH